MTRVTVFIFSIAVVFLAVAVISVRKNIFSTYVPIKAAIENSGKYVQIIGMLDKSTIIQDSNGFSFSLFDSSKVKLNVFKTGIKPVNFEHAEQIVLIGKYNAEENIFIAEKVLTKCPSRYDKKRSK